MKKTALFLAVVVVGAAIAGVVFSQQTNTPIVQTGSASSIFQNSVTLNGQVNPNGYQTSYYFEYGPSSSLGYVTPVQSIGSGYSNNFVSYNVSGLSAGTLYYFRIDAQNQYGLVYGSLGNFSTQGSWYSGQGVSATTNAASDITSTSAIFHAFASTNEYQSTGWFEYGTDSGNLYMRTLPTVINTNSYYSQNTNANPFFSSIVNNLQPGTTYYFRPALQNNGITSYGQVLSFITAGNSTTAYTYVPPYTPPATTYYYPNTYQYPTTQYPTTYQYQQPQVVYVPQAATQYVSQPQQEISVPATTYYGPYYGMMPYVPASGNAYTASVVGVSGTALGNQTLTAFLLVMILALVIVGWYKGAFERNS